MRFPWRYLLAIAALMAGSLLLAACGGEEEEEATPTQTEEPLPSSTAVSPSPTAPPTQTQSADIIVPSPETCARESEPFWHWQAGGDLLITDFFFTTSSVGFAVGEPRTLLRTEDGGGNWTVWAIDSPHILRTIYFSSEEIGWVAGDGGTILQTTDGGYTWQSQQSGTEADLLMIKFFDDKTGWAAGKNGSLLRTTDGGASWLAGAAGPQMTIVDLAFVDAQEGYLVGHAGGSDLEGRVLHTTDGGVTWEDTGFHGAGPEGIYVRKDMLPWVVGGWVHGKIWRGVGDTTQPIEPAGRGRFQDVFFSDAQHGWAVGDRGLAASTRDGGGYWQSMGVDESTDWKMLRFASERDAVLAGYSYSDGIQVAHSSDGGMTWAAAPAGSSRTDPLEVSSMDFVDQWFGWAVGKGPPWDEPTELLITVDGGQFWQTHDVLGGGARRVTFVDRLRGWAIGEGGLVARSDDGGRNWEIQSIPFPQEVEAISFVDRDYGWVASAETPSDMCQGPYDTDSLTLFRTSSGGDEWEGPICIEIPEQPFPWPEGPLGMQFVDEDTGWIVGDNGLILKTTDGGLNWLLQESKVAVDLTDVYFVDVQTGWVTADQGALLQTTDGGAHWKQDRVGTRKLAGVRFVDRETGWVAVEQCCTEVGSVFQTSDGGETWNEIELPFWSALSLDAVDKDHVWVGTTQRIAAYAPVCLSPDKP